MLFRSYKRGNAFFKKGCDLGNGVACYNLGISYEKGLGVRKSLTRTMEFYKRACGLVHRKACSKRR